MNYRELFNDKPNIKTEMPYRVNWCGSYLDCIEGKVITSILPEKLITIEGKRNDTNTICIYSNEMHETYSVPLNYMHPRAYRWTDYVDGCLWILAQSHFDIKYGVNLVVHNDLPSGLGLGSSAAFIMALLWAICDANEIDPSTTDLVRLGYQVERCYLNIPCGLMDFKAIAHLPGVYLLDTSTWDVEKDVLLDTREYKLLIAYDTNAKHMHLGNDFFRETVRNINKADDKFKRYIKTEQNVLRGMQNVFKAHLDESEFPMTCWDLGIGMCWSQRNLNTIVQKQFIITIPNHPAIYGAKAVGSGRKGCMVILYQEEHVFELMQLLCEMNSSPTFHVKPVFA